MEAISWLLDLAYQNERMHLAQDESNSEHHQLETVRMDVVRVSQSMPQQLSGLTRQAVATLSCFMKTKMSGEDKIIGHEVLKSLHVEANQTPQYLQALDALERSGWLELVPDSNSGMKLRPWCWLQARVEMGPNLLNEAGPVYTPVQSFQSNEEYLDAVIEYINQLAQRLSSCDRTICCEDVHQLPEWAPDRQFMEIEARLALTALPVPAAEIRNTHKLSGWQYLFLLGVLGHSEKVVKYDFSDINDVVKLFAFGYNARSMMREHLVGKDSLLIKLGLIENSDGFFFTSAKPTSKAIRLLTGRRIRSRNIEDINAFASKETVFDVEKPRMRHDALMLPVETMESIRAIIHAEKPAGRKIRAALQKNFPSRIGSPTGSTILLYGPPGTGKTLTASYLASELNVPVLKVDCTKILGQFVSENEKNTKRIFDDYETMCKMLHNRPVLLLNEADQLLGERLPPTSAAAQANNNMQNLFLEALERFDGILVATTNRKELLDDAYNRRFTYKLELQPPDVSTRRMLWESHLPMDLVAGRIDMLKLASYPLTGGEIRLVLEQAVRKAAFNGFTKLDGAMLLEIADRESVAVSGKRMRSIGFGAQGPK